MVSDVCGLIGYHIQCAQEALDGPLQMDTRHLLALLGPLQAATKRTLSERSQSLAFLHAF